MVDASAALSALLNAGPSRRGLASEQLHAPHLIDVEVANGLRRRVAAQQLDVSAAWAALDALRRLGMMRYPTFAFLDRILGAPGQFVGVRRRLRCAGGTAGLQPAHRRREARPSARHPLPSHRSASVAGRSTKRMMTSGAHGVRNPQ